MPTQSEKEGSVKSSEYSGTSKSGAKAGEQVMIDPNKAKQVISSGDHTKKDREARRKARDARVQ